MQAEIVRPGDADEFPTPERCRILELWDRGTTKQVSIARAREEKGISTQPHALDGDMESCIIASDEGRMQLGDARPQNVGPGDVAVFPPGTSQWIENTCQGDLVFHCVCVPRFTPDSYGKREND